MQKSGIVNFLFKLNDLSIIIPHSYLNLASKGFSLFYQHSATQVIGTMQTANIL